MVVVAIVSATLVSLRSSHESGSGDDDPPTADRSANRYAHEKNAALSQVSLDFTWGAEDFGNVMEADFTVKNNSDAAIKDLEITCEHFGESGTHIDSNTRTIYDIVKAHSTKKFRKFNMGFIHTQAARSSCRITDLSFVSVVDSVR